MFHTPPHTPPQSIKKQKHEDPESIKWINFLYYAMCEIMKREQNELHGTPYVRQIFDAIEQEHSTTIVNSRTFVMDSLTGADSESFIPNIRTGYRCSDEVMTQGEVTQYQGYAETRLREWIDNNFQGNLNTVLQRGRTALHEDLCSVRKESQVIPGRSIWQTPYIVSIGDVDQSDIPNGPPSSPFVEGDTDEDSSVSSLVL